MIPAVSDLRGKHRVSANEDHPDRDSTVNEVAGTACKKIMTTVVLLPI